MKSEHNSAISIVYESANHDVTIKKESAGRVGGSMESNGNAWRKTRIYFVW